jgi:hypothetical protein
MLRLSSSLRARPCGCVCDTATSFHRVRSRDPLGVGDAPRGHRIVRLRLQRARSLFSSAPDQPEEGGPFWRCRQRRFTLRYATVPRRRVADAVRQASCHALHDGECE